jgi:hypothetical protein
LRKLPERTALVPGVAVKSEPGVFIEVKPAPRSNVMLAGCQ